MSTTSSHPLATLARVAADAAGDAASLTTHDGFEAAVTAVLRAAVVAAPGTAAASLTRRVGPGTRPSTIAATDPVAARLDRAQDAWGEGPCHTVVTTHADLVTSPDVGDDVRWPRLRASFDGAGGRAVWPVVSQALAVPAPHRAALNLYRTAAGGTSVPSDVADAVGLAVTALIHAHDAGNVRRALASNRRIGMAVGVLMTLHRSTEQEAFDLLRTASQDRNVKLRDLAEEVVLTGALPS